MTSDEWKVVELILRIAYLLIMLFVCWIMIFKRIYEGVPSPWERWKNRNKL